MSNCFRTLYWKSCPSYKELLLYFSKNQLGIFVWVYIWILYSVPFIHMSVSLPIPQPWLLYLFKCKLYNLCKYCICLPVYINYRLCKTSPVFVFFLIFIMNGCLVFSMVCLISSTLNPCAMGPQHVTEYSKQERVLQPCKGSDV